MKITYYASKENMGDITDAEADSFRSWAFDELNGEFPDSEITISEKSSSDIVWTDAEEEREEIIDFCSRLWDRCLW